MRARSPAHASAGCGSDAAYANASTTSSGPRAAAPSYLYRSFMGSSSRFTGMNPPLTRDDITKLEREPLTHVTPGRVNDHVCIGMVKTLRWIADRAFRERFIHRATMLVTVAAAAPAAGSVAAYLRMFFKRRPTSTEPRSSVSRRTTVAAEVASPFLAADAHAQTLVSSTIPFGQVTGGGRLHHDRYSAPNSAVAGASLQHSYVDELRGLLSQSECHAVHYQILSSMAEITAVERALVLLLQAFHFAIYLLLFLFYPRMGFRLLAYTAEESSVVWTQMVNDLDLGKIAELRVPKLALHYWGLEGVFTAQGALVPMVVSPNARDVTLFKKEEGNEGTKPTSSASAAAANTSVGKGEGAMAERMTGSKPGAVATAAVTPQASVTFQSDPARADATSKSSQSPVTASTGADGTDGREKMDAEEEALLRSSTATDPSEAVFTLRDVVLLIRSDEMLYRDLNHEMASELDTQPGLLRRLVKKYEES